MVSFGNLPNRVSKLTGILFRGAKVAGRVTLMQVSESIKFLDGPSKCKKPPTLGVEGFLNLRQ